MLNGLKCSNADSFFVILKQNGEIFVITPIVTLPWSFSSSSSGSEILSSSSSSTADLGDRGEGGTSGPSASLPEWSLSPKEPALPPPLLDKFRTGLCSVGEPVKEKSSDLERKIVSCRGNLWIKVPLSRPLIKSPAR